MKPNFFASLKTSESRASIGIHLSSQDQAAFNGLPHADPEPHVIVTDQLTGRQYAAHRKACGCARYCAASLRPIEEVQP